MYISPVGFYNNFKQNSAFKGLYTNPDGSIVNVNPRYIEQAETMRYIRNTVDEAMEECPDDILNNARDTIDGRLLYFTIDRNGKCVISNEEFSPVIYKGKIISSDSSLASKKADGVEACKLDYQSDLFYSDEKKEVKADGFGRKFARVLDNGELLIYDRETFKEQNQ